MSIFITGGGVKGFDWISVTTVGIDLSIDAMTNFLNAISIHCIFREGYHTVQQYAYIYLNSLLFPNARKIIHIYMNPIWTAGIRARINPLLRFCLETFNLLGEMEEICPLQNS